MIMKLSLIIPCFNARDFLHTQLEALANQDYSEPWEVIIADNGSTDNSLAIVEQYKKQISNLRIIDASNKKGASHARNVGALAANSECIAFVDADDEICPHYVAAMIQGLSQYDFVAGSLDYTKLNEPWTLKYRNLNQSRKNSTKKNPNPLSFAPGGNLGIKRSLHLKINGFDESWIYAAEDLDYSSKIQLTGIELHHIKDALVYCRLRHKMADIFKQSCNYAEGYYLFTKKYDSLNFYSPSWQAELRGWGGLIKRSFQVYNKEDRGDFVWRLGSHLGRLKGRINFLTTQMQSFWLKK